MSARKGDWTAVDPKTLQTADRRGLLIQYLIWSILDYYESIGGYMTAQHAKPHRVWTVAEAKARLSEILRLAEEEGPQHIGARKPFVVVPAPRMACKNANTETSRPVAS